MDNTKETMSSKHNNYHTHELRDWGSSTRPALVQDSQGPSAESGKYAQAPIHAKKLSPTDKHLQKTDVFSLIETHKPHIKNAGSGPAADNQYKLNPMVFLLQIALFQHFPFFTGLFLI